MVFVRSLALSSVRQYRILPFGFVTPFGRSLCFAPAQCMGRPKSPFRQLADNATGRSPAHKGLAPSGKMHTYCFAPLKAES